jgi:pimeloyl-ACP methyl ester carboxylesterase
VEVRQESVRYLLAPGFFTLRWWEWGPADGPVVVCVHGLTRNGRDFAVLGEALAALGWRVVAPDLPGRGASDWLPDPALYAPPSYLTALSHLLARATDGPVDWIGTSLGGILGLILAAAPGTPVRRLVLNDIGIHVPAAAIARIRDYVGTEGVMPDLAAVEACLRRVHAPFGPMTDADWQRLAGTSARPAPDGATGLVLDYDPAVGAQMRTQDPTDMDLSAIWTQIHQPVLVLHGAESDVLLAETAAAMAASRPGVELQQIPDVGHAPALMDAQQIGHIARFLAG